ncbi:MAG: hypothetical protein QE271_03140 [Bacteriovoracaceae bacterium]|nr:hypothetical protein [Bacteriovoracaceae bacterium]
MKIKLLLASSLVFILASAVKATSVYECKFLKNNFGVKGSMTFTIDESNQGNLAFQGKEIGSKLEVLNSSKKSEFGDVYPFYESIYEGRRRGAPVKLEAIEKIVGTYSS